MFDDISSTSTQPTHQRAFIAMCVRKLEEAIVLNKRIEARRVFATLDRLRSRHEHVARYLEREKYDTLKRLFARNSPA